MTLANLVSNPQPDMSQGCVIAAQATIGPLSSSSHPQQDAWYTKSADLPGRLPHRQVGLDVRLQEGVQVVGEAVLLRQGGDARLDRSQVVPRQLREEVVQRLHTNSPQLFRGERKRERTREPRWLGTMAIRKKNNVQRNRCQV